MAIETIPYDTSRYAETSEAQIELLTDAMKTGDASYITHVLGVVARARGMSNIAKEAGITREGLYKALSERGDPRLSTLMSVLRALGVKLSVAA